MEPSGFPKPGPKPKNSPLDMGNFLPASALCYYSHTGSLLSCMRLLSGQRITHLQSNFHLPVCHLEKTFYLPLDPYDVMIDAPAVSVVIWEKCRVGIQANNAESKSQLHHKRSVCLNLFPHQKKKREETSETYTPSLSHASGINRDKIS